MKYCRDSLFVYVSNCVSWDELYCVGVVLIFVSIVIVNEAVGSGWIERRRQMRHRRKPFQRSQRQGACQGERRLMWFHA